MNKESLSPILKKLVRETTTYLGQAIKHSYGKKKYQEIEELRKLLSTCNKTKQNLKITNLLNLVFKKYRKSSPKALMEINRAFTVYLEIVNCCEKAYRSFRLINNKSNKEIENFPTRITWVCTAHPTESKSPQLVTLNENLIKLFINHLQNEQKDLNDQIKHFIELYLHVPLTKHQQPSVCDEADYIYSIILKPSVLKTITSHTKKNNLIDFRAWVGGDKDGHPGVGSKQFLYSLNKSRDYLQQYCSDKISTLSIRASYHSEAKKFKELFSKINLTLSKLKQLKENDGVKLSSLKESLKKLNNLWQKSFKTTPDELVNILEIFKVFPGLVVPLELREDSRVLRVLSPKDSINGMLKTLAKISKGGHARDYARAFIVSMTEDEHDLFNAFDLCKKHLDNNLIPVIPLLEQAASLTNGSTIIKNYISNSKVKKYLKANKILELEIMLGYSDSSKESGVLYSRWSIMQNMNNIHNAFKKSSTDITFFHGSGGSVARGGGSLKEQIKWWSPETKKRYKATIQGEMIDRTFHNEFILNKNIESIQEACKQSFASKLSAKEKLLVKKFAAQSKIQYQNFFNNQDFLDTILKVTPYPYLSELKLGSRPSKRKSTNTEFSINSLRAIPWVLCWTQCRVLFPTWWGVGSSWASLSTVEKRTIKSIYKKDQFLQSFVKTLSYSISKISIPTWNLYLQKRFPEKAETIHLQFCQELENTTKFIKYLTNKKSLLWFKPWLQESIDLRNPAIYPLNIIQLIAMETNNTDLLRESVAGIACGMMTTG